MDNKPSTDESSKFLEIWTVFKNPSDYPGKYVARKFILDKPTTECFVADTLEEIQQKMPSHLTKIQRHRLDDPIVVECWI